MPDKIPGQLDLEEEVERIEHNAEKNALFVLRYGSGPQDPSNHSNSEASDAPECSCQARCQDPASPLCVRRSRYDEYVASGTHLDYPEWSVGRFDPRYLKPQRPDAEAMGRAVDVTPGPNLKAAVAWLESRTSVPRGPGACSDRMACNAPNPCRCNDMRPDRFSAGDGEPFDPPPTEPREGDWVRWWSSGHDGHFQGEVIQVLDPTPARSIVWLRVRCSTSKGTTDFVVKAERVKVVQRPPTTATDTALRKARQELQALIHLYRRGEVPQATAPSALRSTVADAALSALDKLKASE